ncbi:TSUP family transporter [Teichococcus oryzae]|uniref:TSUP family transporter n=1 Tax=Teichococcus oryzae TaxID=1608942 RepID=UPI001F4F12DA
MLVGSMAGFLSGVTGVGGGVFLVPQLVLFGWASARRAAGISAPFILFNSVAGFAGTLLAGQQIAPGTGSYAVRAIIGAMLGTSIGQRWMPERAIRFVLAAILLFAGTRLLLRSGS